MSFEIPLRPKVAQPEILHKRRVWEVQRYSAGETTGQRAQFFAFGISGEGSGKLTGSKAKTSQKEGNAG